MIDPLVEELMTFRDVSRLFPGRSGTGVSLATVWRWTLDGRHGHRLESILIGGQRYSSRQAVYRYVAAINDNDKALGPARLVL
jgi:hypothetical protein